MLSIATFLFPFRNPAFRNPDFSRQPGLACNHAQVAATGQQTLAIGGADEPSAGAIMFATFSINDFSFQSIEEYDPVDYWALVGVGGGILGETCAHHFSFGRCGGCSCCRCCFRCCCRF